MGLVFWWMLLVWGVCIAGFWAVRFFLLHHWRFKHKKHGRAVPIAHSDILTELPEYKRALKKYNVLIRLTATSMTIALVAGIILTARPQTITQIAPAQKGRDVMLCLDVSGSLLRVDAIVVNRFKTLVSSFSGQRFGLTVFNSSSTSVIPLADDYDFITGKLNEVGTALAEQKGQAFTDLTSGTLADFDKGTSLVSDGVTSCINNLGTNPLHRSQSVVLATDNESAGKPIITMDQATALAQQRDVHIYAIDPGKLEGDKATEHQQLKKLAEDTAGQYHPLQSNDAISAIIDDISTQESKYAISTPVLALTDKPQIFAYVLLISALISLVLIWRLRL